MKKLIVLFSCFLVTGCATTLEILDTLVDDPAPVCDKESVGVEFHGKTCLKYADGSYRWYVEYHEVEQRHNFLGKN